MPTFRSLVSKLEDTIRNRTDPIIVDFDDNQIPNFDSPQNPEHSLAFLLNLPVNKIGEEEGRVSLAQTLDYLYRDPRFAFMISPLVCEEPIKRWFFFKRYLVFQRIAMFDEKIYVISLMSHDQLKKDFSRIRTLRLMGSLAPQAEKTDN